MPNFLGKLEKPNICKYEVYSLEKKNNNCYIVYENDHEYGPELMLLHYNEQNKQISMECICYIGNTGMYKNGIGLTDCKS